MLAELAAADAASCAPVRPRRGQAERAALRDLPRVLAPAILDWRAQWSARQQAEAAARRQLERRTRRWRRRQALAAVLVAVLMAVGAGLAARAVLDARADQATTEAQAAAVAGTAGGGGPVERGRLNGPGDSVCTRGWAEGKVRAPSRPRAGTGSRTPAGWRAWSGRASGRYEVAPPDRPPDNNARSPPSSTATSRAWTYGAAATQLGTPGRPRMPTTCFAGPTGSAPTTGRWPPRPAFASATRRCRW